MIADEVNLSIACIVEVRQQIQERSGLVAEVAKDLAPGVLR